jgi:hypothetical protein
MSLRDTLSDLESEISHAKARKAQASYEFAIELDKILEALGEGQIGHDRITRTYEDGDEFVIETAYEVRCCAMDGEHRIPLSVMNAEDPIAAAKQFVADKEEAERQEAARAEEARKAAIIAEYHRITGAQS